MPGLFNPNAFCAIARQLLPRKSRPHRIACLALYRALLEQCSRIPLPDDVPAAGPVNPIKHLIRKRFKKDAPITSPRLAVNALKVGYAAEQLLRIAGDGSAPALSKVHTLLRIQRARSDASRQTCKAARARETPLRVGPYPGAPKLLDIRPLPLERLSGRRHVPTLTHTNGYPFLRTGKPQSPYLSRVLRDKIALKDKRYKAMIRLERDVEDGEDETVWEQIVLEELKREGGPREEWLRKEGKAWGGWDQWWGDEPMTAKKELKYLLRDDMIKSQRLGKRMVGVVKKETELRRQEMERSRHAKNDARKQRKRAREDTDERDENSGAGSWEQ